MGELQELARNAWGQAFASMAKSAIAANCAKDAVSVNMEAFAPNAQHAKAVLFVSMAGGAMFAGSVEEAAFVNMIA